MPRHRTRVGRARTADGLRYRWTRAPSSGWSTPLVPLWVLLPTLCAVASGCSTCGHAFSSHRGLRNVKSRRSTGKGSTGTEGDKANRNAELARKRRTRAGCTYGARGCDLPTQSANAPFSSLDPIIRGLHPLEQCRRFQQSQAASFPKRPKMMQPQDSRGFGSRSMAAIDGSIIGPRACARRPRLRLQGHLH